MSYCVVFGCKNRNVKKNYEQLENEAKNKKISFHLFPRNIEKREKWLVAIHLKGLNVRKTAAVCSMHFKKEDYEPGHSLKKLKKDAVPHLSQEESMKNAETTYRIPILPFIKQEEPQETSTNESNNMEVRETIMQSKKVDRSTNMSPDRLFNSPIESRLREIHAREVVFLKRKLSLSNYKRKVLQTKLHSLKNLLKDLRKKNLNNRGKQYSLSKCPRTFTTCFIPSSKTRNKKA